VTRGEIAAKANALAAESSRAGAPLLTADSPLSTLLDWCDWNDPNGEWARLKPEFVTSAWDLILAMFL